MSVTLAETAGFCYGVCRAVELAEQAAASGRRSAMLGPVIHNRQVVADLERRGMRLLARPEEAAAGEQVVIRAHGEAEAAFRALEERGAVCLDGTCPHVRRIQKLAAQAAAEGRQMILLGDPDHPEIRGICGWGRDVLVFSDFSGLKSWILADPARRDLPLTMAAQTTLIREIWKTSADFIKKECTNAKLFDTICGATHRRQSEAADLAAKVDVMVVVGDSQSANSRHLAEICRQHCPRVYLISGAAELRGDMLSGCRRAGLTAGASAPACNIKEVYKTMSEEMNKTNTEESFEELLDQYDQYSITLHTGDKVTGVVTAINPTEVQVDLGCKQAGYIPVDQLTDDPSAKPEDVVKVGDQVELFVIRVNDVDGYATLSKKRLDANKVWDTVEEACNDKTVLEGVVTEENKGGLVVSVKGVRVFVPASQSGKPRGADLSQMVKEKVQLRITEVNRARRRVVGSIRAVQQEARAAAAAAVWESIEVGKHYTGTVKSMTSYGVFVDIGGVDGMVPISDLTWSRIKTPAEVVKVGDTLDVYVISFDPEKKKISLGVKDRSMDPWQKFMETYKVGDVAQVRIVKLMSFGAFAEVVPGVDGLIHISQIADRRVETPAEVLSEGQIVDVKIIDVDEEKKKISLSIRALLNDPAYQGTYEEEQEAPAEEAAEEEAAAEESAE